MDKIWTQHTNLFNHFSDMYNSFKKAKYSRKGLKDICQVILLSQECGKLSSVDIDQPLVKTVSDPMLNSVPPWSDLYQYDVASDQGWAQGLFILRVNI